MFFFFLNNIYFCVQWLNGQREKGWGERQNGESLAREEQRES